jgi:regulatory protein
MPRRQPRTVSVSRNGRAEHHTPAEATSRAIWEDPDGAARQLVVRQLTRAPRTRAQLASMLTRRGFPEDTVGRVLDRFGELQLIDDAAFAQAWVESRHAGRGLARRALAYELRARGVEGETVDAAVAELSPDQEEATARALIRRRLRATAGQEDSRSRVRRVADALARKGYPASLVFRLVREELEAEASPDGPALAQDD